MAQFINRQIVCLDSTKNSLYCEVIEVINERKICWVRPILLVDLQAQNHNYFSQKDTIHDLRFTSDLLWNINDFRIVFDTEYIEFLSELQEFQFDENKLIIAKQKLRLFMEEILNN
ncbi:hypothetical protein [Geminocystis sp. GBBB08]|uniref:hypothetical protein n=1 Tax=Geminocystis sp. GBBB08 TaxID=2604140 RepID=UPI0027E3A4E4|nr:hypothetical protein [Geminocystis sp. GBBB08]MBL1208311.1 hypothetical protein [Geminocystis sp. GBBB08]